jgi:uncharacterized membrane protein
MRGTHDVIDNLDRHERAGHIPALQGGRTPLGNRLDVLQEHWAPAKRALVGTAGAACLTAAVIRRDRAGIVPALVGAALVGRAAANVPFSRLMGAGLRRRAVDVQKTIVIDAPVEEVYAFWSLYENFPLFMSRVLEVRSHKNPYQSRWKVSGPAGASVEFDAEVTRVIPNRLIAWRTTKGSPISHAGVVRFDPEP